MTSRVFRQASLEQLSSPEQLDELLQITSPKYWVGLAAIVALLATATVWACLGTITTTIEGQGVIVRRGGVLSIASEGGGLVLNLKVRAGDKVKANQVIATIAQPVLMERIRVNRQALSEAVQEKDQAVQLRTRAVKLNVDALERQRANTEREIEEMGAQVKIATEQVSSEETLWAKGLVTKTQVLVAREKVIELEDRIANYRAQLKQFDAQTFTVTSAPEEETTEYRMRISKLERDLAEMEKERSLAENVRTPASGEVVEVKVSPGSLVNVGQPIIAIQPESNSLELLAYIPAAKAKESKSGMNVQISPSTVKREEYGYIKGEVVRVSDYPATPAAVMRNFANESLVQSIVNSGPVTEVWVNLKDDAHSPSGFQWSALRSPQITITGGTICSVRIVTRRQRPISMIFPSLKDALGMA